MLLKKYYKFLKCIILSLIFYFILVGSEYIKNLKYRRYFPSIFVWRWIEKMPKAMTLVRVH